MPNTPWVVMDAATREAVCTRCGARKPVPLPLLITEFVRWSDEYCAEHRACKPEWCPARLGPSAPATLNPNELATMAAEVL
jgi:hypothetical protein